MGYYTKYYLTFVPLTERAKEIYTEKQMVAELSNLMWSDDDLTEETFDEFFCEEMKWYEHEEDMMELSKLFKDVFFILEGKGEGAGDVWRLYALNGEIEYVGSKIVYSAPENETILRALKQINDR